jgi:transcriptional regulator with XRE-family HTH domain
LFDSLGVSKSLRKRFGERVKELRRASGMSQEAFADHSGYARTYVSRIERGGANPSLDAIETLAAALRVEEKELFEPAATTKPSPVLVPFAADGSYFNPALMRPRSGKFVVGEKGRPVTFSTFEAALKYLKTMNPAKWRRPNKNGNWGLVSEVRWGPLPKN